MDVAGPGCTSAGRGCSVDATVGVGGAAGAVVVLGSEQASCRCSGAVTSVLEHPSVSIVEELPGKLSQWFDPQRHLVGVGALSRSGTAEIRDVPAPGLQIDGDWVVSGGVSDDLVGFGGRDVLQVQAIGTALATAVASQLTGFEPEHFAGTSFAEALQRLGRKEHSVVVRIADVARAAETATARAELLRWPEGEDASPTSQRQDHVNAVVLGEHRPAPGRGCAMSMLCGRCVLRQSTALRWYAPITLGERQGRLERNRVILRRRCARRSSPYCLTLENCGLAGGYVVPTCRR